LGRLGSLWGLSWDPLGPSWDLHGTFFAHLASFWTILDFIRIPGLNHLVWTSFWSSFGLILGSHVGSRLARERPSWDQEGHEELEDTENLHLKTL
jgi:hypothetical protein